MEAISKNTDNEAGQFESDGPTYSGHGYDGVAWMLTASPRPERPGGATERRRSRQRNRVALLKEKHRKNKRLENTDRKPNPAPSKTTTKPKFDEEAFKEEIKARVRRQLAAEREERKFHDACFLAIGPDMFTSDSWPKIEEEFRSCHPSDRPPVEGPALERQLDSKLSSR